MKKLTNKVFAASFLSLSMAAAHAQIVTDGTTGAQQTLTGTNVTVFEALGTRTGDNLFHSFSTFSVATGQTVNFTGSSDIQNVISRVTGGDISTIDGTLSSNVGSANFFFLNPNGIVIGSGAQIDVPAAIYLSTAETLVFSDGNEFSTDLNSTSTLTLDSPESFGFLGAQGDVSITGAVLDQASGSSLHVSAANINVSDSMLTVTDGTIEMTSVGDSNVSLMPFEVGTAKDAGSITIDNSLLATPGVVTGGGVVALNAHNIVMTDSLLEINTAGTASADQNSGVRINTVDLSIDDSGNALGIATYTGIDQLTAQTGNAADVSIHASGTVTLSGEANITTAAYSGSGNAGHILIQGGQLVISGATDALFPAGIYAYADGASTGNAGAIDISLTGDLTVGQNSTIDGSSYGSGTSANVTIEADGAVTLSNGGSVLSSTLGDGAAGTIDITSSSVSVTGTGSKIASDSAVFLYETSPGNFVTLAEGNGDAGIVNLTTSGAVSVANGGVISAASVANGAAGQVNVTAASVELDRAGASQFTGITVEAANASSGDAGQVTLDVSGATELYAGASIIASSRSVGSAGSISIQSGSLVLDHQGAGNGLETAITSQGVADGQGGNIVVSVSGDLSILDGAQIDTTTFGAGRGGDVLVSASNMLLDGNSNAAGTGIGSQTQGSGDGGNVTVDVSGQLSIVDAAQITTDAFAAGNAGNVSVTAGSISVDGENSAEVTGITSLAEWDVDVGNAVSTATGNAGTVTVSASGSIALQRMGEISSSAQNGAQGNGGDVQLTAADLSVESSARVAAEVSNMSGLVGRTGNIDLVVSGHVSLDQGKITIASTTFQGGTAEALNAQGEINITANTVNVTNYGAITAQSTADIAASNVVLDVANLSMQNGEITTAAYNANGGAVAIATGELTYMKNSLITTSVFGNGNGGDITLDTPIMLMDNGFVQANTAGVGASGGNINMQADAVVPSTGNVLVGGSVRYAFNDSSAYDNPYIQNVIQAAAPDGINGEVNINAPEVDLSAELTVVETSVLNLNDMVWDPCASGTKGTISNGGKGGVRRTPDQPGYASLALDNVRYAFDSSHTVMEMLAFEPSDARGGCQK